MHSKGSLANSGFFRKRYQRRAVHPSSIKSTREAGTSYTGSIPRRSWRAARCAPSRYATAPDARSQSGGSLKARTVLQASAARTSAINAMWQASWRWDSRALSSRWTRLARSWFLARRMEATARKRASWPRALCQHVPIVEETHGLSMDLRALLDAPLAMVVVGRA